MTFADRHIVRPEGFYVYTESTRVETLDEAKFVCQQLDAALLASGARAVLFDTRETVSPGDDVRNFMWDWVSRAENFDRAAIVVNSEMLRTQANMTALSRGAKLRSFNDFDIAVAWLEGETKR